MKQKTLIFFGYLRWVLSLIVWLAIFTSFASGVFVNNLIFGWFPLWVHQVLGWGGIIATIFSAVSEILE